MASSVKITRWNVHSISAQDRMQWYRERRAAAKEAQELRATMANSITAVEVNKSIGMGNIVSQMAVARIASSNKS